MLSMNKSFIYGICFASFTWIISLYLYMELNKSLTNSVNVTELSFDALKEVHSKVIGIFSMLI